MYYLNWQNLKFRSWRGAEIDAVKVEASFSKIGLRQVKKFSFFLLFWLATSEISMKSRGDFAEISMIDLFRSENFQVSQFAEKWLFPKLTFSLLKSENVQGSKTLILRFLTLFDFCDKIKRKCLLIEMIFWGYIKGIIIRLPC